MKSKSGLILAGAYALLSGYLIITQGLFGESFIALILGAPWSFIFAFFEYWNAPEIFLVVLLILPILLNIFILYLVGKSMGRKS